MDILAGLILLVVGVVSVGMIFITLSLNTKSEGLGAAITGQASDAYRGVVGVEEKKRQLLRRLGYTFLILNFVLALTYRLF